MLAVPLQCRLAVRSGCRRVVVKDQRTAGLWIAATGITCLFQQAPCLFDTAPSRDAVQPFVCDRVDPLLAIAIAENAGWQRALRHLAATILENRDELLEIHRNCNRLAQQSRALTAATYHRVQHVETGIEHRGFDGSTQADPLFDHRLGQTGLTAAAELHRLIEAV